MNENQQNSYSHSSSVLDFGKLEADLKCCLCRSFCVEPKQLDCGHICCEKCVQLQIEKANEHGLVGILFGGLSFAIECPQCHRGSQVPTDGQFPTAFMAKKIEQLTTQMALLARSQGENVTMLVEMHAKKLERKWEDRMKWLENEKEELKRLVEEKMAQFDGKRAQDRFKQMKAKNKALSKLVKEQGKTIEKLGGKLEVLEKEREAEKKLVDGKMAQFGEELAKQKCQVQKLGKKRKALVKQMKEQTEKMANLEEKRINDKAKVDVQEQVKFLLEMAAFKGRLKELEKKVEMGEDKAKLAEYACQIGVPNVANLKAHYEREKMLQLIKHGNSITQKLYIQGNQGLEDAELIQCIVELLASTDWPEKMVREVTIESHGHFFRMPQNGKLNLKRNKRTTSGELLSEYELTNKGCHFQVDIYRSSSKGAFNKLDTTDFFYRRLP